MSLWRRFEAFWFGPWPQRRPDPREPSPRLRAAVDGGWVESSPGKLEWVPRFYGHARVADTAAQQRVALQMHSRFLVKSVRAQREGKRHLSELCQRLSHYWGDRAGASRLPRVIIAG